MNTKNKIPIYNVIFDFCKQKKKVNYKIYVKELIITCELISDSSLRTAASLHLIGSVCFGFLNINKCKPSMCYAMGKAATS